MARQTAMRLRRPGERSVSARSAARQAARLRRLSDPSSDSRRLRAFVLLWFAGISFLLALEWQQGLGGGWKTVLLIVARDAGVGLLAGAICLGSARIIETLLSSKLRVLPSSSAYTASTAADQLLSDGTFLCRLVTAMADILPIDPSLQVYAEGQTVYMCDGGDQQMISQPPAVYRRTPNVEEIAQEVAGKVVSHIVAFVAQHDPRWLPGLSASTRCVVTVNSGALEINLVADGTGVPLAHLPPVRIWEDSIS